MESDKRRRIKDGTEFDHLFPPPSGVDKSVKQKADVEDTLKLIRRTVPQTLWQTREIAKKLKGRTLDETCSNIWHFVYGHVQYKRDEDGVEQVRSPRRTWHERETGVDCDCYTEFISSILLNLNIPHKARITKYRKKPPEVPRWQHIYPVVPKNGRLNGTLANPDDYIVIDCVKDDYDDEQVFLESKDYDMRLDYLDGIEQEDQVTEQEMIPEYEVPELTDFADLASVYDDEELELGNIFKKVGGAVKKVTTKVGSAVKTVAQNIKKTAPVLVKKIGDDAGKGIRVINRYANPATILLRNGFLLAMKVNLFNVAGRLRYAYLTDQQARERGININTLNKLRAVKDRAETVYWQAGGKKENLKKGILTGKGNQSNKVPLSGLSGLDDVYMDMDEYRIVHSDPDSMNGLGEIASGAAITAASGAVAAIAATLKQIKGLFIKGGKDEEAFQSETDNAGNAASASANISDDEDALVNQIFPAYQTAQSTAPKFSYQPVQSTTPQPSFAPKAKEQTSIKTYTPPPPQRTYTPPALAPSAPKPAPSTTTTATRSYNETQAYKPVPGGRQALPENNQDSAITDQSVLPDQPATDRSVPAPTAQTSESTAVQTSTDDQKKTGFVQKTTEWVKKNPAKTLLITGAIAGGTYLLLKGLSGNQASSVGGLSGLPAGMHGLPNKQKSKKNKRKKNKARQRNKVQRINLL